MRFREFKVLKEAGGANVFVIGDSIANGIAAAGGVSKEYTNPGKNTSFILQNLVVPFVKSGQAKGATVILSSGAANSANIATEDGEKIQSENLTPIGSQIKTLTDAGAKVALVGVASTKTPPQKPTKYTNGKTWIVDYTGMNAKLASIASSNGATFLGPLEEFDPAISRGDGIHPFNGYGKLFKAGSAGAAARPAGAAAQPSKKDKEKTDSGDSFVGMPSGQQLGSRGVDAMNLQRALIGLGYDVGATKDDGIIGPRTKAGIAKFQTDNKLTATGEPTAETVAAVNKAVKEKGLNLEKAKPEEFRGSIAVSALGDKASRELLTKEAQANGIDGLELAAFLAQCATETGGFRYLSEIWGPTAAQKTYDGRMGNNEPGDGYKYRGRGFIQLTGKDNYARVGKALGVDLVGKPDLAAEPEMGAKTSIVFWKTRVQPNVSNWDDTRTITKLVNGGLNGYDDRMMRFAAFKQDMNLA